ncbi:MAG: hypothetical protein J1F32_06605, partial [Erysipelotrichales bacterium]|nr:hypothetical protein [Erysipelotrichales bacterium]
MKKNAKKILPIVGLMLLSGALAACGEEREPGTLSIMFYNGGYGEEWLQEITDAYMSATGNYVEI